MADLIFEDPRLVEIYDIFDGHRDDLIHYVDIIKSLNVKKVLDVGSGTGCLAGMLVDEEFVVIGLEPAKASIDFAKRKIFGDRVKWIHGDTTDLPALDIDLAVMTGNVAQVFSTDDSWEKNLNSIHRALVPNGYLVFEVRDPAKKAWTKWTKENSFQKIYVPNIGNVEGWVEVLEVSNELVSFRWSYYFESTGETLISDSTIIFRERDSLVDSLEKSGFKVLEVRDAPDRPASEFVFIAQKLER